MHRPLFFPVTIACPACFAASCPASCFAASSLLPSASLSVSLSAYTLLPVPPPPVSLSPARRLSSVLLRCFRLAAFCPAACPSACACRPSCPGSSFSPFAPASSCPSSCSSSCSAAPSGRSEPVPASVPGTSGFAPSSPPLFLSTSACSYSFSSVFTASSFMVFSRRFVCRLLLLFPPFRRLPLLPFLRPFLLLFRRFSSLSACPLPVPPPPTPPHTKTPPPITAGVRNVAREPITPRVSRGRC